MVVNQVYKLSAHLPNTLDLGPRGCVWVQFFSPHDYPLVGLASTLESEAYKWSTQKTDTEGAVSWELIPFVELEVKLKLGRRSLKVPVPWLRDLTTAHKQRLLDLEELLGSPDDSFGLQVRLKSLGFDCGLIDGIIGAKTKAATRQFQLAFGLIPDGISGEATQRFLIEAFGA